MIINNMSDVKNQNNLESDTVYIEVEVAYAGSNLPTEQSVIKLQVEKGSSIGQSIIQSEILNKYPKINLSKNLVGVFGTIKDLSHTVINDDRIEIYRNLYANPNTIRTLRSKGSK